MTGPLVAGSLVLLAGCLEAFGVGRARRDGMLGAIEGGSAPPPAPRRRLEFGRLRLIGPAIAAALVALPVGHPVVAILGLGAVVLVPRIRRRRDVRRAAGEREGQLAHAIDGVGAALRAGLSLSQAIRYAAAESRSPVARELQSVTEREDLGMPLDASLDLWGSRSTDDDVRLVANALRLRVGSGLPGVLGEVGRALRQRRTAGREVRSLTAQARLSGTILGVLPLGFLAFLALTSRRDLLAALSTPAGVAAIIVGLLLQGGGYLWIRRLVRVAVS